MVTRNSGLKPTDPAPFYLKFHPKPDAGEEALNTRGERLFNVLGQDRKFTLEEMKALGFDTYVLAADVIVPLIERAWAAGPTGDRKLARAVEQLRGWDRCSGVDSVAYTYLHFWGVAYSEMFSPARFARFNAYTRRQIDIGSATEQKDALAALEKAIGHIEKLFGRAEVPWGQVNVVVRGGTFPMDGDAMYGPLHPDEGVEQDDGRIFSNDGWGHLMVVMEGEPKQIWSLVPYGESEDPRSPHFNDQAKLHSRRQAKRFWFTPAEILAHTESVWGDRRRLERMTGK